jgi:hypothetical protein
LRTDTRPAEALSGTERDARIEHLLLAGLDEYFAHRYEHAINLWTRVLFLDRQHDRARAYIERARRAQAERLRESEALLQQGIDAFRQGDVARARTLVADALDRGASQDEAQGMLDRIERLGHAQAAPRPRRRKRLTSPVVASEVVSELPKRARSGRGWWAAVLLAAAGVGVLAVGAWGVAVPEFTFWPVFSNQAATAARSAVPWKPEPLPIAQSSEVHLSRAHALETSGRLRDALRVLDRIPVGDSLRPAADRLRADIQRQLLVLAAQEHPPE